MATPSKLFSPKAIKELTKLLARPVEQRDLVWMWQTGRCVTSAATIALRLLGVRMKSSNRKPLPLRARADYIAWKPTLGLALLGLA